MVNTKFQAIILAAGKSTRFNTNSTKLGAVVCGQEMIVYPAKLFANLTIPITFIVGYQKEIIKEIITRHAIPQTTFIEQEVQRGTGHAVLCTKDAWSADTIIIMNGDMPLVNDAIITNLLNHHTQTNATISFVTAHSVDPSLTGYGRVINDNNQIKIVEARDFTGDVATDCCINAGIYCIQKDFLTQALAQLPPNQKTGEIYLTDLIALASSQQKTVETISAPFDQIRGINTLKELWTAEHIKRSELISYWMERGVRFSTAHNVHIDLDVTIGAGSFIGAGVLLQKGTRIGVNCTIEAFSILKNSVIHDNVTILSHSVITDAEIHNNAQVGPFAHIRNTVIIGAGSVIGNFVEVNKSMIGANSKAKHLSYIGNTSMGEQVNIGAGTITCNYNGFTKNVTTIEDNATIGANNSLVAPVTIGKDAITAAGSVITHNVPAGALALGRARQTNKDGYAARLRERYKNKETSELPFVGAIKVHGSSVTEES